MGYFVVNLFFIVSTLLTGLIAGWCLALRFSQWAKQTEVDAREQQSAAVLGRLQELAARVAIDVEEHSTRVEQINHELEDAAGEKAEAIVDVVARLIETNAQMRERLATSEDKLRQQAEQIQTHLAESRTDPLTLLANRRAFDDGLARQLAAQASQQTPACLIICDIDHFKRVNDTHGHASGDRVLRAVARSLRQSMRESDLVARYGGEEFAVVVSGLSLKETAAAAEKARKDIEQLHVLVDGKALPVTASFGVTPLLDADTATTLIDRADSGLYAAKGAGRNRVFCHDGETLAPFAPEPKPEPAPPAAVAKTAPPPVAVPDDMTDLSDLPSRTNFCQQVRLRFAEWKRGGPVFSVVLAKLDPLKPAGRVEEASLRQARRHATHRVVVASVREMDLVGQYAPDCFAMLLPTAGLVNAVRVADRLRQECATACSAVGGGTLSVGVAQVVIGDDFMSLLRRAEEALDVANLAGGDCSYYSDGDRCLAMSMLPGMAAPVAAK